MFRSLAFLLILFIAPFAHRCCAQQAQGNNSDYFDYETKDVIIVRHYLFSSATIGNTVANDRTANDGLSFYIVGGKRNDRKFGDYYLIRFYAISKNEPTMFSSDPTIINSTNTANNSTNYWCIKETDFKDPSKVTKRYGTGYWGIKGVVGQLTVPFKIRPKIGNAPSDFTGDFTLGISGGFGLRLSHYKDKYLNFSLGGGLTSISADSTTTEGYLRETTKWSALTGAFAITFDFNGFQFGGVTGCDFVGGSSGTHWIYNNHIWYSIGIGYQFIKPKESR